MAYSSITLADLRGRIRERLLLRFWTDYEIDSYIREAIRVWNVFTGYFQSQITKTITASTDGNLLTADVATDCLAPLRFVDQTTKTILDPVSIDSLSAYNPAWLSETGTPTKWVPCGLDNMFLHPAGITNSLKIDYISLATVPVDDADFIQIGDVDLSAIIDYCLWTGHLKEGGVEWSDTMPLLQNFLKQAAKHNALLARSAIYEQIMGLPAGGQRVTRPSSGESTQARG